MKARNIAAIFPLLTVDTDTHVIVSKNADITLAFQLELPEIFAVSGDEYNSIHDVFLRAVKVLPVGYMVHKQDLFMEMAYTPDFTDGFLGSADSVARENAAHFVERPYMQHQCYIYLTLPASSPLKRNSLSSSLLKRHLVPKEMQSHRVWLDFIDIGNQFAAIFNDSSQVTLRRLAYAEIVGTAGQRGILENYFSLSFTDRVLYDLSTDEGLSVGGKHTFTYALTEVADFPTDLYNQVRLEQFSSDKTAFPASTGSFFGLLLPFNHVYNQVIIAVQHKNGVRMNMRTPFLGSEPPNMISSVHCSILISVYRRTVIG